MKTLKTTSLFLAFLGVLMILSADIYAQNNRGRNDRNRYYGSRPRVSVNIGVPRYYNYRPVARPRIYYRPAYRLPYRYNHYGPAFGIRINVLPYGYSRFYIGNNPFYYYDGIYYTPYKSGGYAVVKPPLGALVKHLPDGAKATVIDGQKYYELGGTFYQERFSADNKLRYEVVGTDGVLNTTNADIEEEDDAAQTTAKQKSEAATTTTATAPPVVTDAGISKLPAGCSSIVLNGQKFYVAPDGTYYQEMIDGNNVISYKVAGSSKSSVE